MSKNKSKQLLSNFFITTVTTLFTSTLNISLVDAKTPIFTFKQKLTESLSTATSINTSNQFFSSDNFLLSQNQPKRVALVVGNSEYQNGGNLRNPINDANDMASSLRNLGFEVILLTNADLRSMDQGLKQFYQKLTSGAIGLFYYAGHGVQVNGENYLIPVDADLTSASEVNYETLPLGKLLGTIEDAQNDVNIIILDACRDNPFARSWSRSNAITKGLAPVYNSATGSFIAYATGPGNIAQDGTGKNGTFTEMLLKHIDNQNQNIEEVFKKVRVDVAQKTNNEQVPWTSSSLIGDFYFTPQTTTNQQVVESLGKIPNQVEENSIPTPSRNENKSAVTNNTVAVNRNNLFTGTPPKLVTFRTPHKTTSYYNATYYLEIQMPANSSSSLKKVMITPSANAEDIDFKLEQTTAFVVDSNNQKTEIPISASLSSDSTPTINLSLDNPVSANNTITIVLKAKRNPPFSGTFQFHISVFPDGDNPVGFNLGTGRIQLYKSR